MSDSLYMPAYFTDFRQVEGMACDSTYCGLGLFCPTAGKDKLRR
ncbi:MAG: hypothetical protein AAGL17_13115 [Cyanobacteria bacterium J06576_12]